MISLNFDFLPEYLLNRKVSFKKKHILNLNTFYHLSNNIRFWYPHGIAAKSDTIMLSLRNYYTGLQNIESMRSEYKQNELKSLKDRSSITWFSQFMGKPVLILGADISVHETDIWFSLINRSRNFAKKQNEHFKKPVFKMRDETEKDYKGTDIDHLTYRLTNKKMSFYDQWDILIDLMGK